MMVLSHETQPNNIASVLQESVRGASGSRMQHLVLQRTKTMTAYQVFLQSEIAVSLCKAVELLVKLQGHVVDHLQLLLFPLLHHQRKRKLHQCQT